MNTTNLITPRTINQFRNQAAKRVWRNVVVSCFVIAIAAIGAMRFAANQVERETEQQSNLANYPQEVASQNQELRRELQQVQAKYQEQRELRSDRGPLPVLQLLSRVRQELGGKLTIESFDFTLDAAAPANTRQPNGTSATQKQVNSGKVSFQVLTESTTRSSQFLQLLKKCGFFKDVKLNSALGKVDRERSDLRFGVVCSF